MKKIRYTPDAADKLRNISRKMILQLINLYNEKEDFMWSLFGIDTTTQETLDYWKE